ncbi:MAG: response regulator transcription factor [Oscillospiraceae bacterium]
MRLLMVEDDRNLSDAVAMQLRKAGYEVDTCFDGEEGLFYIQQSVYDLILLDRMLPQLDGVALLAKIRSMGNSTPVLMLTALGGIKDRVEGLDAGADDYLAKPFDIRELLARVRALTRRPTAIMAAEDLQYGDLLLDPLALLLQGEKGRCTLSKKEAELLGFLIKSNGQTLSRTLLFGRVWGPDADVEEASLDTYAHFVRRRLSAVSKRVTLVTVRGVGYRLQDNALK